MKSHRELKDFLPMNPISPILYMLYRKGILSEDELVRMAHLEDCESDGYGLNYNELLDRIDEIIEVK